MTIEWNYKNRDLNSTKFIIERIIRIYPTYYCSLLFAIMIYLAEAHRGWDVQKLSAIDIVGAVTGCYAFIGRWGGPFINTSWFIGLIMILYCLYPFLSDRIKHNPNLTLFICFILSCSFRFILGTYGILPDRPDDWFPGCRLFEFCLGVWIIRTVDPKVLYSAS
jgi:peptidoglycan/LPS O-acetylase OafA/YrhL